MIFNEDFITTSQIPIEEAQPYNYDDSTEKQNDSNYFNYLLPTESRTIKKLVNEILDRYEYTGSIIYHEFPDKNILLQIIETIYLSPSFPTIPNQTPENQNNENIHPAMIILTESIFIYELINRRRRYYNIVNNLHE